MTKTEQNLIHRKHHFLYSFLIVLIGLCSCSHTFKNRFALDLEITSEPAGAKVYVEQGQLVGKNNVVASETESCTTPCIVHFDLSHPGFVVGSKDIYTMNTMTVFYENFLRTIRVKKDGYFDHEISFLVKERVLVGGTTADPEWIQLITIHANFNKGNWRDHVKGDKNGLELPAFLQTTQGRSGTPIIAKGIWVAKLRRTSTESLRTAFETCLDQREYDKAEVARREWIDFIKSIPETKRNTTMAVELAKLEGVVGLTDYVLVPLREKLLQKIREGDYETALKVQQLIINREAQLRPTLPQQTAVIRETEQGRGQIVSVQPPDVKIPDEIVVEQKQRYGLTDVMRNLNTLGVTAPLTKKDMAGFKLIDILLGR